jgi:hypothetical protein
MLEERDAERRQHERFEVVVDVALDRSDEPAMLSVLNISAGGVLLRNDDNVEVSVGEQIRVGFDLPELAPPFSIDARVIRVVQPHGRPAALAAMWLTSDAAAIAALVDLLWSLSQRR